MVFFFLISQTETEPAADLGDELIPPEDTTASPKQSLENAFTIKDLSSLLKNLEAEIALNEQHLNDENDKRHMFKVFMSENNFFLFSDSIFRRFVIVFD